MTEARRAATWQDLADLPENVTGEILDGEIVVSLRPWAPHGVEWARLCDPDARTLEVYRRQEVGWARIGAFEGEDSVRAAPFDAVEIDMGRWWVDPER